MEQEKEIIIDGDKFITTRLLPNYKGEYTCTCDECHFHIDWTEFGQYKHCQEVKCIDRHFNEGNRNVWVREKGLSDVPNIHAGMTIDCAICRERFKDDDGFESYYGDSDGKQIEEAASWDYDWKKLSGKWYCRDCWDYVEGKIGEEEFVDVIKTKDGKLFLEDEEEFSAEDYAKFKLED